MSDHDAEPAGTPAEPAGTAAGAVAGHGPAVRRLDDWDAARLRALADEHGTPLYVTDLDRVRANLRRFRATFDRETVAYAAKANTGRAVVGALHGAGAAVEVAAADELRRVRAAGVPLSDVRYTAVNPPAADLEYLRECWREEPALPVTAGAEDTLDRLAERGFDGRLLLRVNPGVGSGHHDHVATGADATFGVPAERAPAVVERAREAFDVVGLHAHVGSGVLDDGLDAHRRALARVGDLAAETGAEVVDVGGGFGVPYRPETAPLDLDRAAAAVRDALAGVEADVVVEPGRYLVADAGVLLTRVNTTRPNGVAGVDASLSTMLRPSFFDAYHPVRNCAADAADRPTAPTTVAGPLCTGADAFCRNRPLAAPERGDLLAVGNAGAYGYEFASTFHSQPRPAAVVLDGGGARLARTRESVADLVRPEERAGAD